MIELFFETNKKPSPSIVNLCEELGYRRAVQNYKSYKTTPLNHKKSEMSEGILC